MSENIIFSIAALIAIIPAVVVAFSKNQDRNGLYWAVLGLAVIGPVIWLVVRSNGEWRTEFSTALWITISATLLTYAATALMTREGWRLGPIVMPYMVLLAVIAVIWENTGQGEPELIDNLWIVFHILISVITYAVVTTAACPFDFMARLLTSFVTHRSHSSSALRLTRISLPSNAKIKTEEQLKKNSERILYPYRLVVFLYLLR